LAVFTWTEVDNVCPRSISPSWTLTTLMGCENCRGICEPDGSGPEISLVRHVTSMSIHLQRSDRVLIIFSQPSGMAFNVRALIVSQCSFLMTDGLGGRRASVTQLWICKKKLRDSRGLPASRVAIFRRKRTLSRDQFLWSVREHQNFRPLHKLRLHFTGLTGSISQALRAPQAL